jgi:hypothetical protein
MRLNEPFTQLPLTCDVARLRMELAQLTAADWRAHPSSFPGNSAALLITVNGENNDDLGHVGQFRPTALLQRLPYTRAVMRALSAPLSRSRFMRVAPGCRVPRHNDVGWHWFRRIRVHVPVVTSPSVIFHCADKQVHMAPGEVWIFDNFEDHAVDNDSDAFRVHLVVDVIPTPEFFDLVSRGRHPFANTPFEFQPRPISATFEPEPPLPIEHHRPVGLSADELGQIVTDISLDLERLAAERKAELARRELWRFRAAVEQNNEYQACRAAARRLCQVLLPVYRSANWGKTRGADMLAVLCSMSFAQDEPTTFERIKRFAAARLRGPRAGVEP